MQKRNGAAELAQKVCGLEAAKRGCIMILLDRASPLFRQLPGTRCAAPTLHSGPDHPDDVCPAESVVRGTEAKPPVLLHFPRRLCCDVHGSEMIQGDGHEKEFDPWRSRSSCSQINMEGKSFDPAHSAANRFSCSHLNAAFRD